MKIEWESLPDYGDLMTVKDFMECVESRCFIDYDGHGYLAIKDKMSNQKIWPSLVKDGPLIDPQFTHIVWFNR